MRVQAPCAISSNGVICTRRWMWTASTKPGCCSTPVIDRDIHALCLKQIADSDSLALRAVIADLKPAIFGGQTMWRKSFAPYNTLLLKS